MNGRQAATPGNTTSSSVFGTPCWVSLATRSLEATEEFYRAVLGWEWRTGKLGGRYKFADVDGVPVAGVSPVGSMGQTAVAWTPFFATADADESVALGRERGGTTAVGPLSLPPGRAALMADRDGAVFGVWEGELVSGWEQWRRTAPAFVELHTRNAFDAAIFYSGVLGWDSAAPGSCDVSYEDESVVLRSGGGIVARIRSGAAEAAPDPAVRPHWQIHFHVADVNACVDAARTHGGRVLRRDPDAARALLSDPDGARFTVSARP
ncbi:VOC family protein [Streptomyces sp. NPDC058657]|uniref:VOC family protein n=1 Tax=unclassified Streptomyces TaxID=2593676 RepID=UPI00364E82B1